MAAPLPFVVAPKAATKLVAAEVNGETCSIDFPVFGAITSGEAIDIREHEYQTATYRECSRLADALVEAGIGEDAAQRQAIRIISTRMGLPVPLTDEEQRAMIHHAGIIAGAQNALTVEYAELTVRKALAAIVHRLPGCEGWTAADVRRLPIPLRTAIAEFIDAEQSGKTPQRSAEELVDEMIETLGKLDAPASPDTPATITVSSSPSPPTGEPPTGSADASGPTLQSSLLSDSDDSPPPTSSKRSRKASAG